MDDVRFERRTHLGRKLTRLPFRVVEIDDRRSDVRRQFAGGEDRLLERDAARSDALDPRLDVHGFVELDLPAEIDVKVREDEGSHRLAEQRQEIEPRDFGVRRKTRVVDVAKGIGVAEANLDLNAVNSRFVGHAEAYDPPERRV